MYHIPPESVKSGEVTALFAKYLVLKEGGRKLDRRFTNFLCYYRFSPDVEFDVVPGNVTGQNKKEINVKYVIPAGELSPGRTLEYYLKFEFDGHENTTKSYTVPLAAETVGSNK